MRSSRPGAPRVAELPLIGPSEAIRRNSLIYAAEQMSEPKRPMFLDQEIVSFPACHVLVADSASVNGKQTRDELQQCTFFGPHFPGPHRSPSVHKRSDFLIGQTGLPRSEAGSEVEMKQFALGPPPQAQHRLQQTTSRPVSHSYIPTYLAIRVPECGLQVGR